MRNSILPHFKLLHALQVLFVAMFLLCATSTGSWADENSIEKLTPAQKQSCQQKMIEQIRDIKSVPACNNTMSITAGDLGVYQEGISQIAYDTKFCNPNGKLTINSPTEFFSAICQAGGTDDCKNQGQVLKEGSTPISLFNCGLVRVYKNPALNSDTSDTKLLKNLTKNLQSAQLQAAADKAKAGAQSTTIAGLQADWSKICFGCAIVTKLYVSSIVYGEAITTAIGQQLTKLLGIGLALYMVFVAAKLLLPFGPQDRAIGLANKLTISIMITVALSFLFLTNTSHKFFWNYVYNPIVDAAINMNNDLLNEGSSDGTFFAKLDAQKVICKTLTNIDESVLTAEQIASKNKLECQVHKIQYVFTYGWATGVYIFLKGAYVSGLILMAIFVFAPLMFTYTIIDVLMRWTFMSVMSPVLMACGCFPLTRKYAFLGVRVMLESAINFVVVAVIAVLTIGMMEQSLLSLNDKLGEVNLPKWLEDKIKVPKTNGTVDVPKLPTLPTLPSGTPTPPVTPPNKPATTGQLERGTLNAFAEEQYYTTTLLAGVLDKNTRNFPPEYPQQTTLTPSGMKGVYEDRALQGTTPAAKPSSSGGGFTCKVQPMVGTFTSGYGWRWGRMHRGIDIANGGGTPIVAVADGIVEEAAWQEGGYGNRVTIRHPESGYLTTYNHMLDSIMVKSGQKVTAGQQVGLEGSTGFSTGPHLHFEINDGTGLIDPANCLDGKPLPNGTYAGTTANGSANSYLLNVPEYDYAMEDFMLLCACGILASFLMKSFANIGAQLLGGQSFGISSSGAFSNLAGKAAELGGALGGVGLGFVRNALTPNVVDTTGNPNGNPIRDMLQQNSIGKMIDDKLESSGAYNRAEEFVDAVKNNDVVKGATDKLDELKAGLEEFSQSRAGQVTDAALSGTKFIGGIGGGVLGVAATGLVSMTENLVMQQAMRVLEATGYGELAGAIGGGFADGLNTGMSWVPENRTVFINRDVVKNKIAMDGLIRDAADRLTTQSQELEDSESIADDVARKGVQDRLAEDIYKTAKELSILNIAQQYDVTGRYNIRMQELLAMALAGNNSKELEKQIGSFERMLKSDTENVRLTPEIEKAIIAASMRGFSRTQPTVAGYTQTPTASVDTNTSALVYNAPTALPSKDGDSSSQRADSERQAAFATLGLKEGATEAEIKQAYKAILKDVARDVTLKDNDARLLAANMAYDLISQARQEKMEFNKNFFHDATGRTIEKSAAGYTKTAPLALAPDVTTLSATLITPNATATPATPQAVATPAKEPELKGLQKVAGYKEKEPTKNNAGNQQEADIGGTVVNGGGGDDKERSVTDFIRERRDFFSEKEPDATKADNRNEDRLSQRKTAKNKPAKLKNTDAKNNIVGFVRSKKEQERDLVAAGRNRGSTTSQNNRDDDEGDA